MAKRRRDGRGRRRSVPVLAWVLAGLAAAAPPAPAGGESHVAIPSAGQGTVASVRAGLGPERFAALLAANRVDAAHVARLDTLIVPPAGRTLLELSPFPRMLAFADTLPTLLLVSARIQAFAAYDSGRLVRWGPVSTGGPSSPTSPGLYRPNWKARRHVSSADPAWIMPWCVNLDDRVGTALHAYTLPGRPVSHCCIRLLESDARWIHDWIVVRVTPVAVLDAYRFDAPPPWRRMPADPDACAVSEAAVNDALSGLRTIPRAER